MKIAVDRTIIQTAGKILEVNPLQDGTVQFVLNYQGSRTVMVFEPKESTAIGLQLVQASAVAAFLESQKPAPTLPTLAVAP